MSTDECHFQGWKRLADEEDIPFTREDNNRLRGVSRMASLEILLEKACRSYSQAEKEEMAARKNGYYRELLMSITSDDILPGARQIVAALKAEGIKVAIGSSSRNSLAILDRIEMTETFDAVADGNDIQHSKPDPEVFLVAARKLGVSPECCLVVEDAEAGVAAAINAGMKCLAVGAASGDTRAHLTAEGLHEVSLQQIVQSNL